MSPERPQKLGKTFKVWLSVPEEQHSPASLEMVTRVRYSAQGFPARQADGGALGSQANTGQSSLWALHPASQGGGGQPGGGRQDRGSPQYRVPGCTFPALLQTPVRNSENAAAPFTFPGHREEFWKLAKAGEGERSGNLPTKSLWVVCWKSLRCQVAKLLLCRGKLPLKKARCPKLGSSAAHTACVITLKGHGVSGEQEMGRKMTEIQAEGKYTRPRLPSNVQA